MSIVLIAAGAVLAWAVTAEVQGVELHNVGLILFFIGIAGLVVSMLLAATPSRRHDTIVDHRDAGHRVVERERVDY